MMSVGAAPEQRDEHSANDAAVLEDGGPVDGLSAGELSAEDSFSSSFGGARMLGLSFALWLLYVPHYYLLRMLGPRLGLRWVRLAANLHWLLTFVGAQRSARRSLVEMRPYFATNLSVSQILRRHLLLKHECFARARVYNAGQTGAAVGVHWKVNPACAEAVPGGQPERGLLVVGYHFNFFQLSPSALKNLLPGVKLAQLRYRNSQSVEAAASPVARLALKRALLADRRSGMKVFYVDAKWGLVSLFRFLRTGGAVMLAADGGVADDFIEVPFFDGTLRVPNGWAKLAAATKSDILLLADKQLDAHTRDGWFFNHVRCTQTSDEAAYAAVAESIRILEQMIREEPWGWHPWQRLRVDVDADGVRRYSLRQYGFREKKASGKPAEEPISAGKPSKRQLAKEGSPQQQPQPRRPRVAVIANSYPPYRVYLHRRILTEVPEVELWSLSTHGNAYQRWKGLKPPAEIRPADFSHGEPTNEQPQVRYSIREWFKGGRIVRWLKEHEVDAVMVQGCGDMSRLRIIRWCKRQAVPCFLTGDFNICSDNHRPFKQWLKHRVYDRAVGWSYGLMPCGAHGLALLHRYGGQSKPAYMFPFVPDVELFQNTPRELVERAREQFGLDPQRRRIVFSARMMEAKRPDLAVAGFAAIADERPEWDLVMIGEGPLRADVEASVPERLRQRVKWLGFLDGPEQVAGVYAQCDVMVLPSDHEPWGVVIVEAAASGLAIVASDVVGAAPELVKPGVNGALFPKGNVAALASALRTMTLLERVEAAKGQSIALLHRWLDGCDPVGALRSALQDAELIPGSRDEDCQQESAHSIRAAGEAVVPV